MIDYEFGHVILIPFPFTDQTGSKKRPAVVVSSNSYNQERRDLVLMAITSRLRKPPAFGEIEIIEWENAGLLKPSVIKPVLVTVEQSLVLKHLGQIGPDDSISLRENLRLIIG